MHRGSSRVALTCACLLLLPAVGLGESGEVPAWAEDIHLVMFGGPPPGRVEVLLNGEFVVEIADGAPATAEVADLLKNGVNELEVRVTREGEAPGRTGPLKIAVAPIEEVSRYQSQTLPPLARIEVPPTLTSAECAQTARFWAGPVETPAEPLKNRYYVVVEGPPANHWITVSVNGVPAFGANSGDTFAEITPHVIKGKNTVVFDGEQSCMRRESERHDAFRMVIVTGTQEYDRVLMSGVPLAMFEYSPVTKKESVTRKQSFRGI